MILPVGQTCYYLLEDDTCNLLTIVFSPVLFTDSAIFVYLVMAYYKIIQYNLDFSLKLQIIENSFETEEPCREEPTDNDSLAVPLATQQVHYLYFNNYKIME